MPDVVGRRRKRTLTSLFVEGELDSASDEGILSSTSIFNVGKFAGVAAAETLSRCHRPENVLVVCDYLLNGGTIAREAREHLTGYPTVSSIWIVGR